MRLPRRRRFRLPGYRRWPGDPPGTSLMTVPGNRLRKGRMFHMHDDQLCDGCHAAPAKWRASHFGLLRSLYFCDHHYKAYKDALIAKGWEIEAK